MGCGTKEPKITQLCLAAIQRLMSHEVVSEVRLYNGKILSGIDIFEGFSALTKDTF